MKFVLTGLITFGVTSHAVIEEIEKRSHTPDGRKLIHHPDDFSVIVDIVDYVVLSENTVDTYFPNAKPEFKHPFPDKVKKPDSKPSPKAQEESGHQETR